MKRRHFAITNDAIYDAIHSLPWKQQGEGSIRAYEAFYLAAPLHFSHGITVSDENRGRPILLLAGTSIPFSDRIDLVKYLVESGYEVASISNQIGGLFDININPRKDRVDSLRHYLQYLTETVHIEGVDILAQSYSAFEIIRVLQEDPVKYKQIVKSIILINPPGLNNKTGVIKHCSRFVWHHVLKGYSTALKVLLSKRREANDKMFARREVTSISTWSYKTLKNPARTMKEVFDIVSYKIKDHLVTLHDKYHYDINFFLQTGDQILPLHITLRQIADIFPSHTIKVVPGGHNDVFFQECQRKALRDFIQEIRLRESRGNF